MKSLFFFVLIAAIGFTFSATSQEQKNTKKSTVSFSNDVFPIIKKRCLPCHAADSENPSEFFMETLPDIAKGGKHGKPIIPKNGDASILVQKIKPNPPFGEQMPLMSKKKLTDEEVELFKTWIDQGARKN
jgi:uncharacterized membrane protein